MGARNLQECLVLQLHRKTQTPHTALARDIIESGFDQFTKKHYKKLLHKFSVTELQLKDAISEIERLNPKPGSSYSNNTRSIEHVVPDFTMKIVEGELEMSLNGRNALDKISKFTPVPKMTTAFVCLATASPVPI